MTWYEHNTKYFQAKNLSVPIYKLYKKNIIQHSEYVDTKEETKFKTLIFTILMRIYFILEVCLQKNYKLYIKLKLYIYGPFLWNGSICLQVICHYWAVNYFYRYLNQTGKLLSLNLFVFRIEEKLVCWLIYLDNLLVKCIEKYNTFSYKPLLKHSCSSASLKVTSRSLRPKRAYVFSLKYQYNSFCLKYFNVSAWPIIVISLSHILLWSFCR